MWLVWLTAGFTAGSIYGSVLTRVLRNRRELEQRDE